MINSVFLIDDEPMFNLINQKILQIAKFTNNVYCYVDASTALKELRQLIDLDLSSFPNIIFLDINMPGMDGWEFLDAFSNFPINVKQYCKVYLLTSSIDPIDIGKSHNYDLIYDFISKPLSIEKLASIGQHKMKF
ncbi:MAG: response regulator [Bacteroidota bacterium]|nr:response regulator [Bacteroidota bacterium]